MAHSLMRKTRAEKPRRLGGPEVFKNLRMLPIGGIIGGGIFVITGLAAAQYAGPAVILSFILAGVAAGLIALIYAELTVHIPSAGPTYAQVTQTLGTFPGWV